MKIFKSIFLLLSILLFITQSTPTFSETSFQVVHNIKDSKIIPQWENTTDVALDLYFDNNKAECIGSIKGISGTSNISATFKLERKDGSIWKFENSWSKTSKGASLSFFESDTIVKGYTYRLTVNARVTKNGITEYLTTFVENTY